MGVTGGGPVGRGEGVLDWQGGHGQVWAVRAMSEEMPKKGSQKVCLELRRYFIPIAYSVDGMVRKEARAAKKRHASLTSLLLLVSKGDRP